MPDDLFQRLWSMVIISDSGCWGFTGSRHEGYGLFVGRRAHRVAYELLVGPIPDGLVLDHICHNEAAKRGECAGGNTCRHRACVNPDHLEAVTRRENALSSVVSVSVVNGGKTQCPQGHPYDLKNTRNRPNGWRECRRCKYASKTAGRRRARASAGATTTEPGESTP